MPTNSSRHLLAARAQARVAAARAWASRHEFEIKKFAGPDKNKEFIARSAWRGALPPSHLPRELGAAARAAGRAIQSAQAAAQGAALSFFFGRAGARVTQKSVERAQAKDEKDDLLGDILIASARRIDPETSIEIEIIDGALEEKAHQPPLPPPPSTPGGRSLPSQCLTPRLLAQRPQAARHARAGIIVN